MPDSQLVEYIREQLARGYHKSQIKKHLVEHSHQLQVVNEAFVFLEQEARQKKSERSRRQKKLLLKSARYLGGSVVLAGVVLLIYFTGLRGWQLVGRRFGLPVSPASKGEKKPAPSSSPSSTASQRSKQFRVEAKDKNSGTVYSTLVLSVPLAAVEDGTEIALFAVSGTKNDNRLGGFYILSPQDLALAEPATCTITYTPEALAQYKSNHRNLQEKDLTLAYYDGAAGIYRAISSQVDVANRSISGSIPRLYGGGLLIIEKSYAGKTP